MKNKHFRHSFKVEAPWKLCNICGKPIDAAIHYAAPDGWQPIETAPKTGEDIEVITFEKEKFVVFWASDVSGECCPPFRGWFMRRKNRHGKTINLQQIEDVNGWRPMLRADF